MHSYTSLLHVFFFNDTATTEIYTLSLHDALPISSPVARAKRMPSRSRSMPRSRPGRAEARSEEHTSELQSRRDLVCRLLLEKKKRIKHRSKVVRSSRLNSTCHKLSAHLGPVNHII